MNKTIFRISTTVIIVSLLTTGFSIADLAQDNLKKAEQLITINKFGPADMFIQNAIIEDPANPEIHLQAGMLYIKMDKIRSALESFNNVGLTGGSKKQQKIIGEELLNILIEKEELSYQYQKKCFEFIDKHELLASKKNNVKADEIFMPGQLLQGFYRCSQGKTSLKLKINDLSENKVSSTFDFNYNNGRAVGELRLKGNYVPKTRKLVFTPGEWIHNPNNFYSVGMVGFLSQDKTIYIGMIDDKNCKDFRLELVKNK